MSVEGVRRQQGAEQLELDFPKPDPTKDVFVSMPAIQPAELALARWQYWPDGQMAVIGPKQSGKTRLLRKWAEDNGAAYTTGLDLGRADITQVSNLSVKALVIDDADQCEKGDPLLAALNLCKDRHALLLISGSLEPSRWDMRPLDLQSRLSAMPVIGIEPPDEKTLQMRLVLACKTKFMKLPEETAEYLSQRIARSFENIDKIAECLEQAADGKALTKVTARRAIEALEQTDTINNANI